MFHIILQTTFVGKEARQTVLIFCPQGLILRLWTRSVTCSSETSVIFCHWDPKSDTTDKFRYPFLLDQITNVVKSRYPLIPDSVKWRRADICVETRIILTSLHVSTRPPPPPRWLLRYLCESIKTFWRVYIQPFLCLESVLAIYGTRWIIQDLEGKCNLLIQVFSWSEGGKSRKHYSL
jgi:hypothetical protein